MKKKCETCKDDFECTEKEAVWKKQCKKCFAIMKKNETEKATLKPASKIDSDIDKISNVVDNVGIIMAKCRDKAEMIFGSNLKPEHIASINTMAIESFKRLRE